VHISCPTVETYLNRLICCGWLLAATLPCIAAEPLAGRWEGTIQIPGNLLPVVVDLTSTKDSGWIGSVIIPGLGAKGVPLKDITVKGSEATFSLKKGAGQGLEATFKTHLASDGTLAGEFVQAGNTAPVELKQVGAAQVEEPPHSTLVSKEAQGEWQGEYQLSGYPRHVTLKLTNNAGRAAAEFVVVGKRVNNLPVDLVTQEGTLLSIYSHETAITFEGRLAKDAREISGTLSQGPVDVPLVLRRKEG